MSEFIWDDQTRIVEKIDGSMILLYWYVGEWHINTRGSFGNGELNFTGKSWSEWVWQLLDIKVVNELDKKSTYVMEFVSPYNKIVKHYSQPKLYLLTVINNESGVELLHEDTTKIAAMLKVDRPKFYQLENVAAASEFLVKNSHIDPTFEGFVLIDSNWRRLKLKSEIYVTLHHLVNNGNFFNPKRLVPLILNKEIDEIITYLPEIKYSVDEIKLKLDVAYTELGQLYESTKHIENQKEFALSIVGKTPFIGILFNARKTKTAIKDEWLKSESLILKVLFKG
jgi:RNA ligase